MMREQKNDKRGCSRVVNFVFFSVDSPIYFKKKYTQTMEIGRDKGKNKKMQTISERRAQV